MWLKIHLILFLLSILYKIFLLPLLPHHPPFQLLILSPSLNNPQLHLLILITFLTFHLLSLPPDQNENLAPPTIIASLNKSLQISLCGLRHHKKGGSVTVHPRIFPKTSDNSDSVSFSSVLPCLGAGISFKFKCTSICLFLFLLFCDHVFCSCVLKLYVQLRSQ